MRPTTNVLGMGLAVAFSLSGCSKAGAPQANSPQASPAAAAPAPRVASRSIPPELLQKDGSLAPSEPLQSEVKARVLLSGDQARFSSLQGAPFPAVKRRGRDGSVVGATCIWIPPSPSTVQAIICPSGDSATW